MRSDIKTYIDYRGGVVSSYDNWDLGNDYGLFDEVTYDNVVNYKGIIYKSIQTPNLEQFPDTSPSYWEAVTDGKVYLLFDAVDVEPHKEKTESGQYFKRWSWGDVTIRNYPDRYTSNPIDTNKLFDIILATNFTVEIKIKYETPLATIEGYFGSNDCKPDFDRKVLRVTPTVLDKYTTILEEWETKIDFADIEYSDETIDLNVKSIGIKTIDDWSPERSERLGFITLPKTPRVEIKLSRFQELDNPSGTLSGYFDEEAPLPALRSVPPIAEFLFQDTEGFYLGDREEILGEDFSSIDLTGDEYVWINTDTYGLADIENSLENIVWYRSNPTEEFKAYKSIQSGNIGNQPDISPLWWEEFDRGELFPAKGDYELSSLTIWSGGKFVRGGGFIYQIIKNTVYCTTKFSREEFRKVDEFDESDNLIPPQGDGWHSRSKIIVEGQNGHLWTRKPFNGTLKDDWVLQDVINNPSPNSSLDPFKWEYKRETRLSYTNSDNSITTTVPIEGKNLFNYIFQNTNDAFANKNVISTFFFNDNEADLPILANRIGENLNYKTLKDNYLNETYFLLTRNLVPNLDLSDASTFPNITLKDFIEDLNKLFNGTLYWFMDDELNLHIEHLKYLDLTKTVIDLRSKPELEFTEAWSFDKSKMFNRVELRQVNANGIDFTENLILFPKIVSNKRNRDIKQEFETDIISTDIRYAIENSTDLEDGVMWLATFEDKISETETQRKVRNKLGLRSGTEESNGYLALSNLINDFGRYEGTWTTGDVNGQEKTFETTARTKIGKELKLKGYLDSLFFITELGIGFLKDSTVDFENENMELTLAYRFNSTPYTERFVLVVQDEFDFSGAQNIWFDFGNYTN